MAGFKGAAPRFFEATNASRGNRPEHVMVAGGRDGPEIGNIPPKDPSFWKAGESARWTTELQGGKTPVQARTQPPFLLEVRPQQREWERGFMPLKDILAVWQKGKESSYIRSEKPEVELTLFQQDEEGKTSFGNIRVLVVDAPIFVGTEEMSDAARGAPLEVSNPSQPKFELITRAAQEMAKLGAPFYITYRGSGGGVENVTLFKTRLVNKETLSGVTRTGEEQVSITRKAVVQMSLFPPGTSALLDSPIWRRLTGVKIQPLNVQSGLAEGTVLPLPFMFIARTRLIYPRAKDKPARVASEFTGKTEKADLALERAAEYLKALKTEAMIKQARALRKQEKGRDADPSPTIALGETGFRVKLTKDQRLVWVSGGQPDPVALLTGTSAPRGDIVVTPEDYLRVVGLPPVSRSKRKRKTPMRANPIVYYRSQAELDNLLAVLGQREYDKLMAKGGIKHISEKPARVKPSSEQYYIPAGRRAAQTGAGLQITRKNPDDYSILSDLPDPSVVYRNPAREMNSHASWQAMLAEVRRTGSKAQYENLHALYRNWAAQQPSEDWSRSHTDLVRTTGRGEDYLRENPRTFRGEQTPERRARPSKEVRERTALRKASQLGYEAATGRSVQRGAAGRKSMAGVVGSGQRLRAHLKEVQALMPEFSVAELMRMDSEQLIHEMDKRGVMHPAYEGEAMALFIRENPRQFRGVKQKMTPKERKTANLYARAQAQAGHIPLETLLTGYGEEGEVGLPALADVQAHRGEKRASRDYAQREGTYKRLRKPNVDNQEAYLQSLAEHAPFLYHEEARGVDAYRARYASQQETKAHMKEVGRKGRAFVKSKLNRR